MLALGGWTYRTPNGSQDRIWKSRAPPLLPSRAHPRARGFPASLAPRDRDADRWRGVRSRGALSAGGRASGSRDETSGRRRSAPGEKAPTRSARAARPPRARRPLGSVRRGRERWRVATTASRCPRRRLSIRRRYGARSSAARPARRGAAPRRARVARPRLTPRAGLVLTFDIPPPALSLSPSQPDVADDDPFAKPLPNPNEHLFWSLREVMPELLETEAAAVRTPTSPDSARVRPFRAARALSSASVRSNPRVSPRPSDPRVPPPARRHADRRRRDAARRRGRFRVVRARARARVGGGGASLEGGGARARAQRVQRVHARGDVRGTSPTSTPTRRRTGSPRTTPRPRVWPSSERGESRRRGSGRAAQARPGGRRRFLR